MKKIILSLILITNFLYAYNAPCNPFFMIDLHEKEKVDLTEEKLTKMRNEEHISLGDILPLDSTIYLHFEEFPEYQELLFSRLQDFENEIENPTFIRGDTGRFYFREIADTTLKVFQKYGLLLYSKAEIDSITNILMNDMKAITQENDKEIDYSNITCTIAENRLGCSMIIGPNCPSIVVKRDSVAQNFIPPQLKHSIKIITLSRNKFLIAGENIQGKSFTIFDLNGKEIYRGILKGNVITTPQIPALLKLGNTIEMLK